MRLRRLHIHFRVSRRLHDHLEEEFVIRRVLVHRHQRASAENDDVLVVIGRRAQENRQVRAVRCQLSEGAFHLPRRHVLLEVHRRNRANVQLPGLD